MGKGEGNGRINFQVVGESDPGYLKPYGHPNTTGLQQEKGRRESSFLPWNGMTCLKLTLGREALLLLV